MCGSRTTSEAWYSEEWARGLTKAGGLHGTEEPLCSSDVQGQEIHRLGV